MVLLKTTLVGGLLLVAGVLLLTVAGPYITYQVQLVQRHDVEPRTEFLVGDVSYRNYSLPGGVGAYGTLDVAQAPSNQSGNIQFMVFDSRNYQLWATGEQSNYLFTSDQQGHSNFTFNTPAAGTYYFVFDDRASVYKKYVTLTLSYNEVSVGTKPDPRIPYVGWALVGVGLAVFSYGLARKPPIPWE